MSITDIIKELKTSAGKMNIRLRQGAEESLIQRVEKVCGMVLPDDFKEFYRFSDGFETDEDLFNMIPLSEIVDNKNNRDKPLYIAEYMIYSDMWELEINPDDCNDYRIVNLDADSEKLILTDSLAVFIQRFLTGGVFEDGGLYNWHNEVKAQIIATTDTTEIVLNVFHEGLRRGIISIKEVIDWADRIILSENEPDYFFIEMSLCNNINDLVVLLSQHLPTSPHRIVHRALFGIAYQKLLTGEIDLQRVSILFGDRVYLNFSLSFNEREAACRLDYDFDTIETSGEAPYKDDEMFNKVIDFLSDYKAFNINNSEQWPTINSTVQAALLQKYIKLGSIELEKMEMEVAAEKLEQKQKALKRKKLAVIIIASLVILAIIDVIVSQEILSRNQMLTKFWSDLFDICRLFVFFVICYKIWQGGVTWLRKTFKI